MVARAGQYGRLGMRHCCMTADRAHGVGVRRARVHAGAESAGGTSRTPVETTECTWPVLLRLLTVKAMGAAPD